MDAIAVPRITPVFRYKKAPEAIAWLERAFGFSTHERHDATDGTVAHAELRFGASAVGLSSAGPPVPGNPWTTVRDGLYVCLSDVDGIHARAAAASADIPQPLRDTDYGAREFSVRDPGGHLWSFGNYPAAAAAGPRTICAAFHYANGQEAVDWLKRALGFEMCLEVPGPDDTIIHAELKLGADVLMLGSGPRIGLWGDQTLCTCVHVADPDAHHVQAAKAGAEIVKPLADTPYGARDYYARDPEGFLWGFSTYTPQATQ